MRPTSSSSACGGIRTARQHSWARRHIWIVALAGWRFRVASCVVREIRNLVDVHVEAPDVPNEGAAELRPILDRAEYFLQAFLPPS